MLAYFTTDDKGFSVNGVLRGLTYIGSASYEALLFSLAEVTTSEVLQAELDKQPIITLVVPVPISVEPDYVLVKFSLSLWPDHDVTMQLWRVKEDTVLYL